MSISGSIPDTRAYAPELRVFIAGQPLPIGLRVALNSASITTAIEGVDRLEIRFANDQLRWLDHPLLTVGREIRAELGYAGAKLRPVFAGEIVSVAPSFPASGMPTLTLAAHDHREKMQQGSKSRSFKVSIPGWGNRPVPDLVVAGGVLSEHQLAFDPDPVSLALSAALGAAAEAPSDSPTDAHDAIRKQTSESDLAFLARIAAENGWAMQMEHEGLLAGRVVRFRSLLSDLTPVASLRYGADLFEFSPRLSSVGQIFGVKARFWVDAMKAELSVSVGWNWDRQSLDVEIVPSFGEAGVEQGDQGPTYTLVDEQVNLRTVSRVILSKLIPKLNQRLTASGSTLGTPALSPGDVVRIEGVGPRYGGLYRLTQVAHALDGSGFRTSFEARKEVWFEDGHLARGLSSLASGGMNSGDRGNPILGGN